MPILLTMNLSGVSSSAPLPVSENDRALLVLKKQQDTEKAQAQAVVDLVKGATAEGVGTQLNVYA